MDIWKPATVSTRAAYRRVRARVEDAGTANHRSVRSYCTEEDEEDEEQSDGRGWRGCPQAGDAFCIIHQSLPRSCPKLQPISRPPLGFNLHVFPVEGWTEDQGVLSALADPSVGMATW